jgi:heme-degrading monooxygenase HmoA
VIGRLWKTGLRPGCGEAYERFAREISLPMFQEQKGFLGCIMSRTAQTGLVHTFWQDQAAVDALDRSPSYRATVERILKAGILAEPQSLEVAEVHLADLAGLASRA